MSIKYRGEEMHLVCVRIEGKEILDANTVSPPSRARPYWVFEVKGRIIFATGNIAVECRPQKKINAVRRITIPAKNSVIKDYL